MDAADPLLALRAFDTLEVGPPALTRERLSVPYTVVKGDERHTFDLQLRWQEPVFDPDSVTSRNLAAMIGAQVALNYGLFCDNLVFHGVFDAHDRAFLRDMAANTAREIYVNKILADNRFLVPGTVPKEPVVQRSYLRARVRFPDAAPPRHPVGEAPAPDRRIAVLASGGKDSLLSHGLLDEAGFEVHDLFGNESGRHWYTALNGFRHLDAVSSHTARVWMNTDRLFPWMLQHLPFVRPDFARMRADSYPIRLWTVAVFLFAVLPLVRKRGLGRLVVGDEHDTTRREKTHGIPHYDGLFDQSRFFDEALCRLFARKGWHVQVLSLLRPCSELLIETVLAERYPELLAHQVSCHAASIEGERVVPCGRCEKCRRIVGMLSGVGVDPAICGYDEAKKARCLEDLRTRDIHQEEACADHTRHLLAERGLLPEGSGRPHPEVLQLRFDALRAPVDGVPPDLRRAVWPLLLHHATGAVRREGRRLVAFDPLAWPGVDAPESAHPPGARPWVLGELNWPAAERRLAETDVALLPVGAIEQHGPHLPLDIDAWDARHQAMEVARRCSQPRPLVLPLIPYGVSYHHDDFAGTLSIAPETLAQLVYEIGMAAARQGIKKLLVINGHGGNSPALNLAAQRINRDARIFTAVDTGETSDAEVSALITSVNDAHAGEYETSTALSTRPHLVDHDAIANAERGFTSRFLEFTTEEAVPWYAYTDRISPSGVLGDPTRATAEKGARIWEITIRNMVELVEHLKGLTLEEIHQRRY